MTPAPANGDRAIIRTGGLMQVVTVVDARVRVRLPTGRVVPVSAGELAAWPVQEVKP